MSDFVTRDVEHRFPQGSEPQRYREGDRCMSCGYWWWERDGEGWHSLVPITYADHPEEARLVGPCAVCIKRELREPHVV